MKQDNQKQKKNNNSDSIDEKKPRILKGKVVSDKTDKTVVVAVDRYKQHPKYGKRYRITKKYKAHDEENKHGLGDKVSIKESKPFSKDKKWIVVEG